MYIFSSIREYVHCINDDNVRYDDDGIIRKFSRLSHSDLSRSAQAPAYLPRKSTLAKLILKNIHEVNAHCGAQQLTSEMRQKYWLPHDRAMSTRVVRECTICRRHNGLPFRHPMSGPIPEERVKAAPPFAHTGVDLMGPFTVKESGSDVKRWVGLYTCLVTRLIHLEVVTDLSAKAFLMTLKRFIARRGCPKKMISDNGTNFRLTSIILGEGNKDEQEQDTEVVSTYIANNHIDWSFIPPASPWMGGSWERMVGIVKTSMSKAIGRSKMDLETLHTVMCECEAITNSRPLTVLGENGSEILRPVDFIQKYVLFGTRSTHTERDANDPNYEASVEISSHKEAKMAIEYSQKFGEKYWKLWRTEYLLELRERQKSHSLKYRSATATPHLGEIVIVDDDDNAPRGEWRLARIIDLVESRDKEIRSAMIRLANGREVQRPLMRLIPLEIGSEFEEEEPSHDSFPTKKSKKGVASDEATTKRVQPERKAKTLATNRNRAIDLYSVPMLLTIISCLLLPTVNCQVLTCIKGGIAIDAFKAVNNHTVESELCINDGKCIKLVTQPTTVNYQIPLAESIHEYNIQWRAIVNGVQHSEQANCLGTVVCELIDCFLCSELMGNPHCWPKTAIATIMLTLYILLTILIVMWKLCIGSYIKKIGRKMTQSIGSQLIRTSKKLGKRKRRYVDTESEDEDIPLLPHTRSERSRIVTILAVTCVLFVIIPPSMTCQVTHIVDSSNKLCTDELNQSSCVDQNERTVAMSSHRREICLRTKRNGNVNGQIKLNFKHVLHVCNPVVKYFTRNVNVETVSVKRCSRAGSCTADRCAEVTSGTYLPELNETYKYPGIARCSESCGGIYCGCLLPTSGCLFSRTFVTPQDSTVYRMITCPTWKQYLVLNMERIYSNGSKEEMELSLRPEVPKSILNATLTVDWITTPNIPLLSTSILQGEGNDSNVAMLVPADAESAIICPSAKTASAMSLCHVPDLCHCSATEATEICNCRAMNVSSLKNSLEHRLPITSEVVNVFTAKGKIAAHSHESIAEISILNFELTSEQIVHNDNDNDPWLAPYAWQLLSVQRSYSAQVQSNT